MGVDENDFIEIGKGGQRGQVCRSFAISELRSASVTRDLGTRPVEHELVHVLAHLDDAILELGANLSFGLFDDGLMCHPDDDAERNHGDQQKSQNQFLG